MLVLTRRQWESIRLDTKDGPIDIAITRIDGDKVRVGLTAPVSVRVMRAELLDKDGNEVPRA